jgi:hypothetical protein
LFSRLPAVVARVFENPSGSRGVSKVEIARFSRLFWLGGLRKRGRSRAQFDFCPFSGPKIALFSRVPAMVARVFATPVGSEGFQIVEIAWFSCLFWMEGV